MAGKLHELINKLCPEGVRYCLLEEVAKCTKGEQLNRERLLEEGYPVINGGINPSGFWNTYNFPENRITISQGGASAGFVNWQTTKFWAGAHCYVIVEEKNIINYKFLYYLIKNNERVLTECQYGAGIPALAAKTINKMRIPVPPLEIQDEIVRILDSFAEVAGLNALLNAELDARKKQYEYYRNKLLFADSTTPKMSLRDVSIRHCSGSTPLKSKDEYYNNGTVPWLRTQDVMFNEIYKVNSFITELAVKETSVKWIPANCVIVAISGASAGRCGINKIPLTTNQHCLNIEINPEIALYKYVFYCVVNQYEELLQKKEGARGDLNSSRILSLKIPVPSIERQREIIKVLDSFDSLTKNMKDGIPAEIEARQKQYEYYRDNLLTFKELEA